MRPMRSSALVAVACATTPATAEGTRGGGAVKIGAELIGAGCAAIVHAAVPGWFTETAGKSVTRIYDHIQQRKSASENPENWPDYEI